MDFEVWHIWVIAALVFGILEIFTPSFVALSVALGCLFAALASGLDLDFKMQLLFFSGGTALAFFGVRPFMLKYAHRKSNQVKTNTDALIGKSGRVTEIIDNAANTGRVVVEGDDWRALSEDGSMVNAGEIIEVLKVDSTRLMVRKSTSL